MALLHTVLAQAKTADAHLSAAAQAIESARDGASEALTRLEPTGFYGLTDEVSNLKANLSTILNEITSTRSVVDDCITALEEITRAPEPPPAPREPWGVRGVSRPRPD